MRYDRIVVTLMPSPSDQIVRLWTLVNGTHVNVYQTGTARANTPPLLLLHGGGLDSALLSWGVNLAPLAAARQVFALDLPGYGESDTPNVPYTLDWYIATLVALIDVLNLAPVDLCGLSLGGGIALGFALRNPKRVRKLVLVSSYGLDVVIPGGVMGAAFIRLPGVNALSWQAVARSTAVARLALRALLVNRDAISEELVTATMAAARRPQADVAWTRLQHAETGWLQLRTNYRDQLSTLTVPTLLLHGADDRLVPPIQGVEAHARIPGSRLQVLPHCGHWLPRDQPERFRTALTEFLG